jgi:hypothetical protein
MIAVIGATVTSGDRNVEALVVPLDNKTERTDVITRKRLGGTSTAGERSAIFPESEGPIIDKGICSIGR